MRVGWAPSRVERISNGGTRGQKRVVGEKKGGRYPYILRQLKPWHSHRFWGVTVLQTCRLTLESLKPRLSKREYTLLLSCPFKAIQSASRQKRTVKLLTLPIRCEIQH